MITKLINPFKYIAGVESLVVGILIILATAYIGYSSNTHFPDLISIKTCPDLPVWYFLLQGLSNWIVISTVLYSCAAVWSPSSIRFVDIFGTQALARFPYLIASFIGFSGSINKFGKYMLWTVIQKGESISLSTGNFVLAISLIILTFLLTIWLVALMFNAFKISANLKGTKVVVLFIIAFIVSMVITSYLSKYLFSKFS